MTQKVVGLLSGRILHTPSSTYSNYFNEIDDTPSSDDISLLNSPSLETLTVDATINKKKLFDKSYNSTAVVCPDIDQYESSSNNIPDKNQKQQKTINEENDNLVKVVNKLIALDKSIPLNVSKRSTRISRISMGINATSNAVAQTSFQTQTYSYREPLKSVTTQMPSVENSANITNNSLKIRNSMINCTNGSSIEKCRRSSRPKLEPDNYWIISNSASTPCNDLETTNFKIPSNTKQRRSALKNKDKNIENLKAYVSLEKLNCSSQHTANKSGLPNKEDSLLGSSTQNALPLVNYSCTSNEAISTGKHVKSKHITDPNCLTNLEQNNTMLNRDPYSFNSTPSVSTHNENINLKLNKNFVETPPETSNIEIQTPLSSLQRTLVSTELDSLKESDVKSYIFNQDNKLIDSRTKKISRKNSNSINSIKILDKTSLELNKSVDPISTKQQQQETDKNLKIGYNSLKRKSVNKVMNSVVDKVINSVVDAESLEPVNKNNETTLKNISTQNKALDSLNNFNGQVTPNIVNFNKNNKNPIIDEKSSQSIYKTRRASSLKIMDSSEVTTAKHLENNKLLSGRQSSLRLSTGKNISKRGSLNSKSAEQNDFRLNNNESSLKDKRTSVSSVSAGEPTMNKNNNSIKNNVDASKLTSNEQSKIRTMQNNLIKAIENNRTIAKTTCDANTSYTTPVKNNTGLDNELLIRNRKLNEKTTEEINSVDSVFANIEDLDDPRLDGNLLGDISLIEPRPKRFTRNQVVSTPFCVKTRRKTMDMIDPPSLLPNKVSDEAQIVSKLSTRETRKSVTFKSPQNIGTESPHNTPPVIHKCLSDPINNISVGPLGEVEAIILNSPPPEQSMEKITAVSESKIKENGLVEKKKKTYRKRLRNEKPLPVAGVKKMKKLDEEYFHNLNKEHWKLVKPQCTEDDIVRRSTRTRTKPLDYWRRERAAYNYLSDGIEIIGIDSPAPCPAPYSPKKFKKPLKKTKSKKYNVGKHNAENKKDANNDENDNDDDVRYILNDPSINEAENIPVENPVITADVADNLIGESSAMADRLNPEKAKVTEDVGMQCEAIGIQVEDEQIASLHEPTIPDDNPYVVHYNAVYLQNAESLPGVAADDYVYKRLRNNSVYGTGIFYIRPYSTKPEMLFKRGYQLLYVITDGLLRFTVTTNNETRTSIIRTNDLIVISQNSAYSLTNLTNREAKLTYTILKKP